MPDTCASLGQVCHGSLGIGTCGPPTELEGCQPNTGCASADLACTELVPNTGVFYCLRSCGGTGDCPLATTTCFDDVPAGVKFCFFDVCGPDWKLSPVSGPSYYAPCNAQGTGDGTCLPVESPLGTIGICLQGGPVTSGGACAWQRVDGGGDQLCTAGTICAAYDGGYACNPFCAASSQGSLDGGGPYCTQGAVCANVLNASFDFGQCLQSCNGSGTCAGSAVCVPLSLTQSVCYP
jgi:hypothetical protein